MNDYDLDRLKHLPVPPPRQAARKAALEAALAEFDAASAEPAARTQGNIPSLRLKDASSTTRRSISMRPRPLMALAASIAAIAIAIPAALYLLPSTTDDSRLRMLERASDQEIVVQVPVRPVGKQQALTQPPQQAVPGLTIPELAPSNQSAAAPQRPEEDASKLKFDDSNFFDLKKYSGLNPASPAPVVIAPGGRQRQAQYRLDSLMNRGIATRDATALAQYEQALRLQKDPNVRTGFLFPLPADTQGPPKVEEGRDRFENVAPNPVRSVATEPVSTFSIDVDTASYGFLRRALNAGRLPQKAAVRVEEMINYFPYNYPLPQSRSAPFQPTVTVLPSPWNPANKLVHIAIKGYDVVRTERPRANLVLLIDTSGSMQPEDRLPLLKNAFVMFLDTLQPEDTVGIVTYAGDTRVALQPTKVAEKQKIVDALSTLEAGGSTAGAAGIQRAYRMAEDGFDKAAVNRVILATDGDFNVGITNQNELKSFIERKRDTGVYLSILGVGRDNYNDALMQTLAQNGNGAAAYIDTLNEARKVLVEESSSTLFPIAKDVKIQLEFNPRRVSEYRLVGYETRILRREDFSNDKVDAGDIGSGHSVTAIYEITPVGAPKLVEDLRYGTPPAVQPAAASGDAKTGEYAFLKIRYKLPKEDTSRLIEFPVTEAVEKSGIDQASTEVRFSAAVAALGQLLRGEPHLRNFGYDDVIALASAAKGDDPFGYRAEFVNLARMAKSARP